MWAKQIRAARALLGWTQQKLSGVSTVSINTLKRMEKGAGVAPGKHENVLKVKTTLEQAGVEFLPETDISGPGVRLKKLKP